MKNSKSAEAMPKYKKKRLAMCMFLSILMAISAISPLIYILAGYSI